MKITNIKILILLVCQIIIHWHLLRCIYVVKLHITKVMFSMFPSNRDMYKYLVPEVESVSMSGLIEFRVSQTFRRTFEGMLAEWKWRVLPFWTWNARFPPDVPQTSASPADFPREWSLFKHRSIRVPLCVHARYVLTHVVNVSNMYRTIQKYSRGSLDIKDEKWR